MITRKWALGKTYRFNDKGKILITENATLFILLNQYVSMTPESTIYFLNEMENTCKAFLLCFFYYSFRFYIYSCNPLTVTNSVRYVSMLYFCI